MITRNREITGVTPFDCYPARTSQLFHNPSTTKETAGVFFSPKELEVKYHQHKAAPRHYRPVLLQTCLPCEFLGAPLEIFGFLLQLGANTRHMIELFSSIQDFINILSHNDLNIREIIVQLGVLLAWIAKLSLLALNERIVMNELKGASRSVHLRAPLQKRKMRNIRRKKHSHTQSTTYFIAEFL